MAKVRAAWFGVLVDFDDPEITQVCSIINNGGNVVVAISAVLNTFGVSGTASEIAQIISALCKSWLRSPRSLQLTTAGY
jgi:hypothetical protein